MTRIDAPWVTEPPGRAVMQALGQGYFVTWVTTYTAEAGEVVGRQRFRVFKFDPKTIDLARLKGSR